MNNLSSNDKRLLTQLSNNDETTIVFKNNAYYKGQFYEKKENDWVISDITTFNSDFVFGMY